MQPAEPWRVVVDDIGDDLDYRPFLFHLALDHQQPPVHHRFLIPVYDALPDHDVAAAVLVFQRDEYCATGVGVLAVDDQSDQAHAAAVRNLLQIL